MSLAIPTSSLHRGRTKEVAWRWLRALALGVALCCVPACGPRKNSEVYVESVKRLRGPYEELRKEFAALAALPRPAEPFRPERPLDPLPVAYVYESGNTLLITIEQLRDIFVPWDSKEELNLYVHYRLLAPISEANRTDENIRGSALPLRPEELTWPLEIRYVAALGIIDYRPPIAGTKTPGSARGMAWLIDRQERKIVCAAAFRAENDTNTKYISVKKGTYGQMQDMRANLSKNALAAAFASLKEMTGGKFSHHPEQPAIPLESDSREPRRK